MDAHGYDQRIEQDQASVWANVGTNWWILTVPVWIALRYATAQAGSSQSTLNTYSATDVGCVILHGRDME